MSVKHSFEVEYFHETYDLDEELTVPQFEAIVEPLVEKAAAVADAALSKAGVDKSDLNGVLLAGGTSQVPLVKDMLEQRFDCRAMIAAKDLMWLIAKGAAIHHRDLMAHPGEATKLILGSDLYLETYTHGRPGETLLVPSHQTLPHSSTQEFPVNPHSQCVTVQLLTESGTHGEELLRLERREINVAGRALSRIGVKVTIDRNKSIKISVSDPKTKVPLDNVEIEGEGLSTPEEIKAARAEFGLPSITKSPTRESQRYAVGIDLGTTTCEAIVWDLEGQEFHRGIDEPLLSQVLVRDSGAISVDNGEYNTAMEGYFSNFKVDIGLGTGAQKYTAHGKHWPPEILSAHLLATIWQQLQTRFGAKAVLTEAVITVPSDFSEDQTALVLNAAKVAGIESPTLLSEPVAAFLAYADYYPDIKKADKKFLIFDFGGGTTDVCVIETKPAAQPSTLASNGNNAIGGKDITNQIADTIVERFIAKNDLALKKPDCEHLRKVLFKKADKAKIELSMVLVGGEA